MDEEETDRLLKVFRGSKRAAEGILIPLPDGSTYHLFGITRMKDVEGFTEQELLLMPFCAKSEIVRLRSLRNSHDYLLRLRAEAIANSPRMIRVMSSRRKAYQNSGKPWSLTHYYHTHDGFHKAYLQRLQRKESKALKHIPSGLVPIIEANATCMASLTGEIVVVSESLYHFYYFMTIALYGRNFDIEMADRVNALLIAYRIMNESEAPDFDLDPRGDLPPKVAAHLQELVHRQMQFTFGHEYSHFLCGHISTESVPLPVIGADARIFSHGLEFEADANAVRLMQHDPSYAKQIAAAGMSVLVYLHMLMQLKKEYTLKSLPVSETHPNPIDRLWSLFDFLGSRSPLDRAGIDHMLSVGVQVLEAFPYLLRSANRPDILSFYGSIYLPSYIKRMRTDRVDF